MCDIKQWTIDELKAELEKRELSQAGNKSNLIDRLAASNDAQAKADAQDEEQEQAAEDHIKLEDSPRREEAEMTVDEDIKPAILRAANKVTSPPKSSLLPVKEEKGTAELKKEPDAEWQTHSHLPDSWLPIPLFLVRNVPIKAGVTESDVKEAVEAADPQLKVRSVYFDDRPKEAMLNRRTALVRLQPLRPNAQAVCKQEAQPENGSRLGENKSIESKASQDTGESRKAPDTGDCTVFANWAVSRLKSQNPSVTVGNEQVQFENSSLQVQLYIGNLSPEWQQDEAFEKAMATYGPLERVFIVKNAEGHSKGYGFVEYTLPGAALKCKQAMDEIERDMRPDPQAVKMQTLHKVEKKPAEGKITEAQKAAGWQEGGGVVVKLLRAEWANIRTVDNLFSRVLYVANLRTSPGSQKQLKELFSQYGEVQEVSVPRNKQTNTTKGFAFVLFQSGISADRAYRALELSGTAEIGGALVSFANSAKHADIKPGTNSVKAAPPPYKANAPGVRGGQVQARGNRVNPPSVNPRAPAYGQGQGRGVVRGGPRGAAPYQQPVDPYQQHPQIQLQADLAAQQALQERMAAQMRLQQQAQAQAQTQMQTQMQTQFQAQLRQQQLQMQQMQQQLEASQRQIQQVQAKAQAEAEARRKAEEEARRVAAAQQVKPDKAALAKMGPAGFGDVGRGSAGYGGYGGPASASMATKYSSQMASGYGDSSGYGQAGADTYGGQALPAPPGYGASQSQAGYDAYGGGSGGAYGHAYDGSGGYGGYGGSEGAHDADYSEKYGVHSSYGYGDAGYAGHEGSHGGSGSYAGGSDYADYRQGAGYGEASAYGHGGGSAYGSQSSSGQKRAGPQGSYGGYGGTYGSHGGDGSKRQRY